MENKCSSVCWPRVAEASGCPGRAQLELFSPSVAFHLNKMLYTEGEALFCFSFNLKNNLQDLYRIVCHVCCWVSTVFIPMPFVSFLFLLLIIVKYISAKILLPDF